MITNIVKNIDHNKCCLTCKSVCLYLANEDMLYCIHPIKSKNNDFPTERCFVPADYVCEYWENNYAV